MNQVEKKKEVDLVDYWRVIVKRKWVAFTFMGALVFFTAVFSFLATPQYKSTSTLLIEEGTSKILSMEDAFGIQAPIVRDLRFFNTQLKLLKSKSLAERIVKKLNLLSRPEFSSKKKSNIINSLIGIITFNWATHKKESSKNEPDYLSSLNAYSDLAESVRNKIKIKPIRETKLVEISYISASPLLSAEIVNTLAEEFINFSIEKRYEKTQQASDFLSAQIAILRDDLAAKERELQRYGQEKNLFFLSDRENTAVNKFAGLYEAYTQAQIERIKAEAAYRELKDVDIDSIPQSISNPAIQQLKADYTRKKSEYEEKSKVFKPDYPEMVRLKSRLDSMKGELRKAVDAVESDYRAALKREYSLKNLLEKEKGDVAKMNSSAITYNSLKIEIENIRKQLNSLIEKQKETFVSEKLGGLRASNISIIDRAEISKKPISPKKKLNLILALFFGLFGGLGLCFLLEYLDNTVKGPEDVERLASLPSLGVIPYLEPDGLSKKKRRSSYLSFGYTNREDKQKREEEPKIKEIELINHLYAKLSISEDYRTVRTSILLSHADTPPKTISITSSLPKEGKSATVVNMAVSFSQLDEKVLVIDADLRRPRLNRVFKTRNVAGLSSYLTGKIEFKDAIQKTSIKNIWILPSGPIPPNPAELLNSRKMREMVEEVKKEFDIIFFDTPPVLAVIDAVIVSSLVDSTVVVVNASKLTHKPFLNAVEELKRAKAKVIGVIFNKLKVKKGDYYYMDYYRYYRHRYYGEEETQTEGVNNKG